MTHSRETPAWHFPLVLGVLLFSACQNSREPPRIDALVPPEGIGGRSVVVEILGAGFHPHTRVDFAREGLVTSETFDLWLEAPNGDRVALLLPARDSTRRMTATVPGTTPAGIYDLVLRTPAGQEVTRPSAFTVFDPQCDLDQDGYAAERCGGTDCDDEPTGCGADCSPGLTDACDGFDNDCDTAVDEDHQVVASNCGLGACAGAQGQLLCQSGVVVDTCDPLAGSSMEGPPDDDRCFDGVDQDCDGATDYEDPDCWLGGQGRCETNVWPSQAASDDSGGAVAFAPLAALSDGGPVGGAFAAGDWSGPGSRATHSGFSSSPIGGTIIQVQWNVSLYLDQAPVDDEITVTVFSPAGPVAPPARLTPASLSLAAGEPRAHWLAGTLSGYRPVDLAELGQLSLEIHLRPEGADDGATVFLDGAGLTLHHACNTPPVADLVLSPAGGPPGTNIGADATGSSDSEEAPSALSYRWDFEGDGVWDEGPTPVGITGFALGGTAPAGQTVVEVVDSGGAVGYAQATWYVADVSGLFEVTTDLDEDDPEVAGASPQGTGLSLREALTLANTQAGPDIILLYDATGPRHVLLDPARDRLPDITDDTVLLGRPGSIIDGSVQGRGTCLGVSTGIVTLAEIEIRGCSGDGLSIGTSPGPTTIRDVKITGVGIDCISMSQASFVTVGPGVELIGCGRHGLTANLGTDLRVVDSIVHGTGGDGIILGLGVGSGTDDGRIVGTTICQNAGVGIRVERSSTGATIMNSTVVDNGGDGIVLGSGGPTNFALHNSVIAYHVAGEGVRFDPASLVGFSHNLIFGNQACTGCEAQTDGVYASPLFVDRNGLDFRLRGASPAVDRGTDLGEDRNGPSPGNFNGAAPDLGAWERP